jgi:hypothetical protein
VGVLVPSESMEFADREGGVMRWGMAAAAAGVVTIAIGLLRLVEREERESEHEDEAWTRRPRQLELAGHRRYEGWRNHQPGDWR